MVDGEGTVEFTATSEIMKGVLTLITEPSSPGNTFTVSASGTATFLASGSNWPPTSADPHYAFSVNDPSDPFNTIDEIYAYMDSRAGSHSGVGATSDPSIGTNNSPNAIVCDWIDSQIVSLDYASDRNVATLETLANCTAPNYFATSTLPITPLSLTPFNPTTLPVSLQSFEIN